MKNPFLATVAILALSTSAQAAVVGSNTVVTTAGPTPVTVAGTSFSAYNNPAEAGGGGFTTVNGARPDTRVGASDTGSLEIHGDKSRYVIGNLFGTVASAGFSFQSLDSVTFDWNVDVNGSGQAHGAPVTRVVVADTDGRRVELNWEYVYNGGTAGTNAPVDQWFNADATSKFYANIRAGSVGAFGAGAAVVGGGTQGVVALGGNSQSNLLLSDWHQYFSANAKVVALSFGAGSGFGSNFVGYLDNVNVTTTTYGIDNINFQAAATAGAVPEPATWGMMVLGFGLAGAAVRRRRVATVRA